MATTVWKNLELAADIGDWGPSVAPDILASLQNQIPVKTGATRDSLTVEWTGEGFRVEGSKVALYIEAGTRPHPIDSTGPWSLHNAETDEYFGPHVEHPGTAANDFVGRAFDEDGEAWIDALWQRIAADWESGG